MSKNYKKVNFIFNKIVLSNYYFKELLKLNIKIEISRGAKFVSKTKTKKITKKDLCFLFHFITNTLYAWFLFTNYAG